MGLSSFPSAAEGVLPVLVMNTVLSVAFLKNMLRSLLQVVGASGSSSSSLDDESDGYPEENIKARERRISITQFKSLCHTRESSICEGSSSTSAAASACSCSGSGSGSGRANTVECCVCLCGFEADEEVSELSCKHFFHKGCLEKWFDNKHSTCPLCRSIH
ncbi:probable E3 ubiquitin-protein ligase XERICO [Herrania umbratica]|uniref:Probable E3 ubiquitin-protein ligase XERICO n=1 Tax=Herrania umbratica TaxID=108875 RepID=A0A6J1B167_9ROSI|nr:probable E3 ubiquitin-protein ligase XERICO [Herrania umbratica]